MKITLIIAMVGMTPPFAGKDVTLQARHYDTMASCEQDKQQFLSVVPPTVRIIGATCQRPEK